MSSRPIFDYKVCVLDLVQLEDDLEVQYFLCIIIRTEHFNLKIVELLCIFCAVNSMFAF